MTLHCAEIWQAKKSGVLLWWKTGGITASFVYAGLSKHSIIKTSYIDIFCLVHLVKALFALLTFTAPVVLEKALQAGLLFCLSVYLALHCTRELQEQSQIFQETHLPAEARLIYHNRAPGHSPQFSRQPWPHIWTCTGGERIGTRKLVRLQPEGLK